MGLYWGYVGAMLGLHLGYIGVILRLYWGYLVVIFKHALWQQEQQPDAHEDSDDSDYSDIHEDILGGPPTL